MNGAQASAYSEEVEKPIDYKYYIYLFKKNFYVIFTFFVITITLAFIYTSKLPVRYQATAQLIVELPRSTWVDSPTSDSENLTARSQTDEYYTTQINIMKGSAVLKQAVQELRLKSYFEVRTDDEAVEHLRSKLVITRVPESRLFDIIIIMDDPKLAANSANAVARAYIRKNFEDLLYYSREIMAWLPQEGSPDEKITLKDPTGGVKQMSRQELIDSLPSIRTDETLKNLIEKKNSLESELKLLLNQYREKHPEVIKLRANVKFYEESISNEKQRIIEGLKTRAEGHLSVSQARIIEEAQPPKGPLPNKRMRSIVIAGIAELVIACIIIFLMDFFDDTIHTVEDFERKGLVLPFLGPLPLIKDKQLLNHEKGLAAFHDKKSEIAESFRFLRVAINFSASPESLKTLVFSSCLPHEGKSFTSHNIAVSLAMDGNRTLLVDADLRRPTIHRVFRIDNSSGLSNFLTSDIDFDSVTKESFIEDLKLIPSGPSSPNPGAILGSERMKQFLALAREKYDRVIIDCPPLTGIGDGFVVGSLIGHIIMVIASGKTPMDLIRHTQIQLMKAGVPIIGVVLNMVDMDKERYAGYSKYYYNTYYRYYKRDEAS